MTLYNELLQILFYLVTLGRGGEVIEKLVNQILYFFFLLVSQRLGLSRFFTASTLILSEPVVLQLNVEVLTAQGYTGLCEKLCLIPTCLSNALTHYV